MTPLPRLIQQNTTSILKCMRAVMVKLTSVVPHGKKVAMANDTQTRLTMKGRRTSVANVWKLWRITVYSSLNSPRVLTQADLSSTATTAVAAAATAVASSPEDSDAGSFANDAAAATATGWSS